VKTKIIVEFYLAVQNVTSRLERTIYERRFTVLSSFPPGNGISGLKNVKKVTKYGQN
jgi:hypothetical protein